MKVKLRTRGLIPRLVVVTALLVLAAVGVVTGLQSHRDLRHYEVER